MSWYLDDGSGLVRVEVATDTSSATHSLQLTSDSGEIAGAWEMIAQHGDIIALRHAHTGRVIRGVCERKQQRIYLRSGTSQWIITPHRFAPKARDGKTGEHAARTIIAPLPGRIVAITAHLGDTVIAGQSIVIIEAMKMQNELCASREAVIREIHVGVGHSVETGALLVTFE